MTLARQIIAWPPIVYRGGDPLPHWKCRSVRREDGLLLLRFHTTLAVTRRRDEEPILAADYVRLRDALVGLRWDEIGEAEVEWRA